jgi:hypothetical protein
MVLFAVLMMFADEGAGLNRYKCLLWSNGLLEYAAIGLYYGVAIQQYVHISYMAQGYNVS